MAKTTRKTPSRRLKATTPEDPSPSEWEGIKGGMGRANIDRGPESHGNVDIWPILAADAPALVAEIERGDHDAYISFLQHCDRSQHDGGRPLVQAAIRARKGE